MNLSLLSSSIFQGFNNGRIVDPIFQDCHEFPIRRRHDNIIAFDAELDRSPCSTWPLTTKGSRDGSLRILANVFDQITNFCTSSGIAWIEPEVFSMIANLLSKLFAIHLECFWSWLLAKERPKTTSIPRASAHFLVDGKDFTEPGGNPENGFDLWRQCETTAGKSG